MPAKTDKRIVLTADECYCGVQELYDVIADKVKYRSGKRRYNCIKICVSKPVMNQIFTYYKETYNMRESEIGMLWVFCGPKATLPDDNYVAVIQEGFFMEAKS